MKVSKYFLAVLSNMETVFLFQPCISDSQEGYNFHVPSLTMSHCPAVYCLKIFIRYEDAATWEVR